MRILLDQNLSPKLIRKVADVLPGLESVYDHGLVGASDPFIFDWADLRGRFIRAGETVLGDSTPSPITNGAVCS